jgi:hypothetical protein
MSAHPMEIRMAHLEGAYEQINERLGSIEGRLTALDQKIDLRFDSLDKKITGLTVAGMTVNAAMFAAVIGAVIVLHH